MRRTGPGFLSVIALLSVDVAARAYNWSITDQSPLIKYYPLLAGDNSTSWNSTYSGSSWAKSSYEYDSIVGHGKSAHTTDVDDATASVGFVGTAVYVWGQTPKLSSTIYVDGVARSFSGGENGIIGAVEGLENRWHDVKVDVEGLDFVQLYGFTFTSDIANGTTSNSTVDVPLESMNKGLNLTGEWNVQYQTVQDALTGQETNYTTLSTSADLSTSVTLAPPINTTMMFLYGLVDPYSTTGYSVSLLPPRDGDDAAPVNQTYNASADWISGNQVMYQAQLTPGTQYVVKITFVQPSSYVSSAFSLGSIVYVQASVSPHATVTLSKGAIAGIVVGALSALGFLAFFAFAPAGQRLRRRVFDRGTHPAKSRHPILIDQPSNDGGVSPYPIALSAMRHQDSEVSVAKSSLHHQSPSPLPFAATSMPGETGIGSPLSSGQTASSPVSDPSINQQGSVSRQEKEASLAILLPHLASQSEASISASHSQSPSTLQVRSPLRDVDAGPVDSQDMSPILPPEYQTSWARQRHDVAQ